MKNQYEHFLGWLRDAHALEQQIEILVEGQVNRLENYPSIQSRLVRHIDTKVLHQETLHNAIKRLGGDTSVLKDAAAKLMATGQNVVGSTMSDEVVKGAMTLYVFTQVAISSYTVLIAAAEAIADIDAANALKYVLEDEIAMSKWLLEDLPSLTQSFLCRI